MKVLLVEDDGSIAEPLRKGLERQGMRVAWVRTGGAALDAAPVDLVLLDLGLPDMDGYDVCRKLRAHSSVPIIVVTARSEEMDRVLGLELGADDYIVKPFGFHELVARVRAVMRRAAGKSEAQPILEAGRLSLDRRTRTVSLDGEPLALTAKEFDLLAMLLEDAGAVYSRRQIFERVWETSWLGPSKTLDVHVASLRKKLGSPDWIEAVRGVGFRLRSQP